MASLKARSGTICGRTSSKKFVWADIGASEDEIDGDMELLAPPVVDDSYREGPLPGLESSRDGLNRDVAGLTVPKDFAFTFHAANAENIPVSNTSSPTLTWQPNPKPVSNTSSPTLTWQPNLNAPEFIPTMTMACPLVGFSQIEAATPEKSVAPLNGAGMERRRKGFASRKRPPTLHVPAKRMKSAERQPITAAIGQSQMPPASEEEWQHRISMRRKAISVGKESSEYKWFTESKESDQREVGEPVTPDPTDRAISKRHWKYAVQVWRMALKQRYTDEGHSVISTEECLSISAATTYEPEGTASIDGDNESIM